MFQNSGSCEEHEERLDHNAERCEPRRYHNTAALPDSVVTELSPVTGETIEEIHCEQGNNRQCLTFPPGFWMMWCGGESGRSRRKLLTLIQQMKPVSQRTRLDEDPGRENQLPGHQQCCAPSPKSYING